MASPGSSVFSSPRLLHWLCGLGTPHPYAEHGKVFGQTEGEGGRCGLCSATIDDLLSHTHNTTHSHCHTTCACIMHPCPQTHTHTHTHTHNLVTFTCSYKEDSSSVIAYLSCFYGSLVVLLVSLPFFFISVLRQGVYA